MNKTFRDRSIAKVSTSI